MTSLTIKKCREFPLRVIEALRSKLSRLNSFEYWAEDNEFLNKCRDINLEQLDALKITMNETSFHNILSAIARGSKMIRKLSVMWCDYHSDNTKLYKIVRLFDKLTLFCG